jgi:hypothetical protein
MAFWWVFQEIATSAQRWVNISGPSQNERGPLFHWTNMTLVQAGDVIFSGYDGELVRCQLLVRRLTRSR